jgi:hypothetical protein
MPKNSRKIRFDGKAYLGYAKSVTSPLARFMPSRQYSRGGLSALASAALFTGLAMLWPIVGVAAFLFFLSASVLLFLAFRPTIEIHTTHLLYGSKIIPWYAIRKVDRTGWVTPLVLFLELENEKQQFILYPGDLENSKQLLRLIRKHSSEALLDGVPHQQVWGDAPTTPVIPPPTQLPSPRYKLLRSEDEAEVEKMFQQLKTAGRIDSQAGPDGK